ncbi:MAG: NrdH-redoxin [Acidimicrobiia bacterium]|nr:NrdH-redoxin [Acidimicrobiia bacterium]
MTTAGSNEIEFYWRPGCGFCMSLDRQLQRHGIAVTKHNIWENPSAAAHVRNVARGNETVPTVTIGPTSLVNPSIHEVASVLTSEAPHLLPEDYEAPEPGPVGRFVTRLLGGS